MSAKRLKPALLLLAAFAMAGPRPAVGQSAGLPPEWETRKMLEEFTGQVNRLKPLLEQVNPKPWVAAGAPEAYLGQWKATCDEVDYLVRSIQILSAEPEKLTAALDAFLRLQALESMLISLAGGVRRYQNPAVAQLLTGVMGENSANRDKLRQYVIDLAAVKEQELAVMDKEAQRCRQNMMRQPSPRPAAKSDSKGGTK